MSTRLMFQLICIYICRAWMSSGVIMKVCLKDSATNAELACQTLDRYQSPDYSFTLTAPSDVNNAIVGVLV